MAQQDLIQSCERFLILWHENGRATFQHSYPNLNYDQSQAKTMHVRKVWITSITGPQAS